VNLFLLGAIAMASLTAAVFFLRFWRDTGDQLFLLFALGFGIEGLSRTLLALSPEPSEGEVVHYLIRLVAYALIAAGIVSKNLTRPRRG
jgi:hypothetical protein